MSANVAVVVPEGVAVSCDSRSCAHWSDDLIAGPADAHELQPVSDSVPKVAVIHDRFIVSLVGGLDTTPPAVMMRRLAKYPAVQGATSVAEFLAGLEAFGATQRNKSRLAVAFVEDEVPRCGYIEFPGGAFVPRNGPLGAVEGWDAGVYPLGFADHLINVCRYQLSDDRGTRLTAIPFPFAAWSIADAARFSRRLIEINSDMYAFAARGEPVGGPAQTAIVTAEGARMLTPRKITVREYTDEGPRRWWERAG